MVLLLFPISLIHVDFIRILEGTGNFGECDAILFDVFGFIFIRQIEVEYLLLGQSVIDMIWNFNKPYCLLSF